MNQNILTRLQKNLSLLKSLEGNFNYAEVESKSWAFFKFAFDPLLLLEREPKLKQDSALLELLSDSARSIKYFNH